VVGIGGLWFSHFVRQARTRPVLPLGEPEIVALLATPARAEAH
jgi:hypothetical protein